ncbi:MAG TPA: EI24 domain-containing protein [Parasegetibacter sp.]
MLKEIVIAIQSYFQAHQFIRKHKLWKLVIIPGLTYAILFLLGMYFFWNSTNDAVTYISNLLGLQKWLIKMENSFLNFLFILGELIVRLILVFFYFSLFKYLFLIIGSPFFAYLSEKTEAIIEGKEYPFSFKQLLKDIVRGIKLALRNTLWQTVYTITILILSFIPVAGWITPLIALFFECYYYGFSMLDYSCERRKMSAGESVEFIARHKGLAIGNGLVFYVMHSFILVGWILAPTYAVVAATLSLYNNPQLPKNKEN